MPDVALRQLEDRLVEELASYDWKAVSASVAELASMIESLAAPLEERTAKRVVGRLRESRRFEDMLRLSTAIGQSGQKSPQVRRQMAQAFIDLGRMAEAKFVLEELLSDPQTPSIEQQEAWGLIGRVHKQAYVDVEKQFGRGRPADLDRAIEAYGRAYRANPGENYWQGINVAALLNRRGDVAESASLARSVLETLELKEAASRASSLSAWDVATRMEACVALGRHDEAVKAAEEYVRSADVDAFKLDGTRRQLEEVWRLSHDAEPGRSILPLLRGALLRRFSGGIRLQASDVSLEGFGLEARFGPEGSQTMAWYRTGLDRCKGVARIESKAGKGVGTGWLVRAQDFLPARPGGDLLLLTNAHVVATREVRDQAMRNPPLLAGEAQVDFRSIGESGAVVSIKEVAWCSPIRDLDASLCVLDAVPPNTNPVPLHLAPVEMRAPSPRMYIIGHPGGRDLEISLYDNRLVGCDETRLHYRTPTEGGSSGSPVFESDGWCAVALHHRGLDTMPMLDGSGKTYPANEGIAVLAIQKAAKRS